MRSALWVLVVAACGPSSWRPVSDAEADRFAQAIERARAEQGIPGLAMAVVDQGRRRTWFGTAGLADIEEETPWEPGQPHRIGSVTKTMTAALVLQLAEEGVLDLDDRIEVWTEMISATGARMDVRQTVRRGDEDLVTMQVTLACIDRAGRPKRIPERLRHIWGRLIVSG